MTTNLEKYKKDLTELIANGDRLLIAMQVNSESFRDFVKKKLNDEKKLLAQQNYLHSRLMKKKLLI